MPKPGQLIDSVLKSGGNEYHGEVVIYGSSGNLESSNLTDELRAAGVRNVPELHGLWDFSVNTGGRIIRDRLWFFANYRNQGYRPGHPERVLSPNRLWG